MGGKFTLLITVNSKHKITKCTFGIGEISSSYVSLLRLMVLKIHDYL